MEGKELLKLLDFAEKVKTTSEAFGEAGNNAEVASDKKALVSLAKEIKRIADDLNDLLRQMNM